MDRIVRGPSLSSAKDPCQERNAAGAIVLPTIVEDERIDAGAVTVMEVVIVVIEDRLHLEISVIEVVVVVIIHRTLDHVEDLPHRIVAVRTEDLLDIHRTVLRRIGGDRLHRDVDGRTNERKMTLVASVDLLRVGQGPGAREIRYVVGAVDRNRLGLPKVVVVIIGVPGRVLAPEARLRTVGLPIRPLVRRLLHLRRVLPIARMANFKLESRLLQRTSARSLSIS